MTRIDFHETCKLTLQYVVDLRAALELVWRGGERVEMLARNLLRCSQAAVVSTWVMQYAVHMCHFGGMTLE